MHIGIFEPRPRTEANYRKRLRDLDIARAVLAVPGTIDFERVERVVARLDRYAQFAREVA